ncbi:MAG TPA: DMT family transporter [Paracoccaceae bacterium]|nr:DMT family transporter [Paracoccaceae bacterium]HMO71051.1 DMT family transporter [Paracoccaceae bacterium]
MSDAPARPVAGVLWMVATGLCFVAVTGLVRWLGTDLPAAQSAFLRFGIGALFFLPLAPGLLRAGLPQGSALLFAQRGIVHVAAVVLWFYAMARLPVAEVTAIGYLNPVLVTLGAALFFGEALALRRLAAVGVAILGALIVLRPGLREVTPAHLAQVGAAFCFAGSYLYAKRLSGLATPGAIVALLSLTVTVGLAPFALAVWVPPTGQQLAVLALVAAFASAAHYCMMRAFAAAPLTVTQPVTFLQLVWATALGSLVFSEPVDAWVILGGSVILGAVLFITWREAVLRRRAAMPPVPV